MSIVPPAVAQVVTTTWANAGGTMLIYLAALQSIPAELYEAAELDGASIVRRIRHVALPQIRGVMLILLILQIIATIQLFTEPFTMTSGGPVNATTTVVLLIYYYAFQNVDLVFPYAFLRTKDSRRSIFAEQRIPHISCRDDF